MFAAAERDGFGWSVHGPHTIIGYAVGNAMNMGIIGLCLDLPRNWHAVYLSGISRAVEQPHGHGGRTTARTTTDLGGIHI